MSTEARFGTPLSLKDEVRLTQQRLLKEDTLARIEAGTPTMFDGVFDEIIRLTSVIGQMPTGIDAIKDPRVVKLMSLAGQLEEALGEGVQVFEKWRDAKEALADAIPPHFPRQIT